jgi:hypothetical protein
VIKKLILFLIAMLCKNFMIMSQSDLPGIIPSVYYKGSISNHFDYSVFASTTFIVTKSTIEGRECPSGNSEIYLQPSLVYKYSDRLNFATGYTGVNGNNFTETRETEQQVIVQHKAAVRGLMSHRDWLKILTTGLRPY